MTAQLESYAGINWCRDRAQLPKRTEPETLANQISVRKQCSPCSSKACLRGKRQKTGLLASYLRC